MIERSDVERAAEVIRGRLPPHAAPFVSHARARRVPEGRAAPAHGLVQAARDAHEARVALGRGEGARGRRWSRRATTRRRPPGARAQEGLDVLVVMWAARTGEGRRDARLRRRGRSRGGEIPARRSRATRRRFVEETGRTLVHPFDDPSTRRVREPGPGGRRGPSRRRDDRRAGRRRRAHRRRRVAAADCRVVGVEPEARRRCTRRSRPASRVDIDAELDRRRPQRAVHAGRNALDDRAGARRRRSCSSARRRSPTGSASSTRARSSPASRGRGRRRRRARGEDRGRAGRPSSPSSRAGTRLRNVAAGILASR